MKRISAVMCLLLLFGNMTSARLTRDDFPFVHIDRSNSSISYDGISRIFQDSRGFLWVGTFKGLNRYDGDRFTVYDKDDFGIASDFIHCIEEDGDGNIWIGTDRGVVIYDWRNDDFRPFRTVSDEGTVIRNKVNNIFYSEGGAVMWLTANHQGLFSYDFKSGVLRNHFVKDGSQTLSQNIRRFIIDSGNCFWLSLYYTDLYWTDSSLTSLSPVLLEGGTFENDDVEGLAFSHEGNNIIYVVSVKKGLCVIDTKRGSLKKLLGFPEDVVPLEMCVDAGKCIWIPTTKGLYRYDLLDGSHLVLSENRDDPYSLSGNYVYTAFVDNAGGLWVGTKDGGLNYSGPEQSNFTKCYTSDTRSLENSIVSGFADDGRGCIWVTTEKAGLFRYDMETGKLHGYRLHDFRETICTPCWYDGYLWLGSLTGLIRLDVATGAVKRYSSFMTAPIEDNKCYVVYRTDSDELYVGTTLGLMRYIPETDGFESVPGFEGCFVTGMDEDSRGNMWVSTFADGVLFFDPDSEDLPRHFRYPDSLPTDKVSGIYVDGRDRVWVIGFSFGFFLYNPKEDSFIRYDRSRIPDFPSDVYFCAEDDRDGNIWLSTDHGVMCFNPSTKEVETYTKKVGLLDDVMKKGSFKDSRGNIYFASQNGFVHFNPESFYVNPITPNLVITDFRVGDEIIRPGKDSPLKCNVDLVEEIHLKPGQNSFGVSASVLSFSTVANNKIQCFLEGYDKRPRVYAGAATAYWYNVPSGTYRLVIRGSSNSGKWNVTHRSVNIIVERSFWSSPLAIFLYLLLLSAILVLAAEWYSERLKAKERARLEAFESEMELQVMSETLPTILLVSDDEQVRRQVKACVNSRYNIVSAMSAKRAFITLENVKVSLIIADVDTRHLNGTEFCSSIRGDKEHSRLPVIILSSDSSTRNKIAYMDMGVTLYVDKPFSDDYLYSCIKALFDREMSRESAISQAVVSMRIHRMKLDSKDEDFINLLEKTIMDNLDNVDFDSSAMEQAMSMSRSSLVRRMKSLLDTTPNEYLKRRRLAVAAKMLQENNVRVNEICYAVGFKYPSYFTKCFREVYGVLPADYRKKCSKNTSI